MARLGLLLLLSLLSPSNALAQSCYCTAQTNPVTGNCYANAECWACAPGAYAINWQQAYCLGYVPPAPTCQPSSVSEQRSCPANYSGFELWQKDTTCSNDQAVEGSWYKAGDTCAPNPPTCQASSESQQGSCPANTSGTVVSIRQSTCPDPYGQPVWGQWQTQSNCSQNPPTCQISTEAKTEACQAGFIGQKDFSRQSTCPDPYGQPIWGQWNLTSDSCTKSVTNPTNPLSPISPVSPMSAPAMPVAPVTVPTPAPMTTTETQTDSPSETAPSSTPSESAPADSSSAAPSAASPAPGSSAGNGARAAALVQRLTMIGALPAQPTIIETLTLSQQMPEDVRKQQDFLMELFSMGGAFEGLEGMQNRAFQQIMQSNTIQGSGYE